MSAYMSHAGRSGSNGARPAYSRTAGAFSRSACSGRCPALRRRGGKARAVVEGREARLFAQADKERAQGVLPVSRGCAPHSEGEVCHA
jgi:hypothetical protein